MGSDVKLDGLLERSSAFERMERSHGFFDARFDGWSVWRVMRNTLHRQTQALPFGRKGRRNALRILEALVETPRFFWLLLTARRRQVLVKTSRSGLRMQRGDNYRDVYFDGLLERGLSHFKIEENNSPDFAVQARRALFRSNFNPVFFTFWGTALGKAFPVDALAFCKTVAKAMRRECDVTVAPEWLLLRISTVHWQAKLYGWLLKRLRPAAVMVSDTGEYGLRLAALRAGIRFIELQHGVFGPDHPDAIPAWVSGTDQELLLPDVLACRGEYWVSELRDTRQGRSVALAVGNEMIDAARLLRMERTGKGPFRIVVSSQGLDTTNLCSWLDAVIDGAPSGLKWSMAIKLHPVYDAGSTAFTALARHASVTVIGGGEAPNIYELLAEADVHLSIASACHFDAAALGVPSIVIPLEGHEAMRSALDDGAVMLAASPADTWRLAASAEDMKCAPERFSATGFLDNLQRLIPSRPA